MTTTTTPPNRRVYRMFQMRMPVFMIAVAGAALIFWAAKFNLENRDSQTSWVSRHVYDLSEGEVPLRRAAAELLYSAPDDQFKPVTSALVAATRDPDAQVRAASLKSLASLMQGAFKRSGGVIPSGHKSAIQMMLAGLRDPDPRVRIEALRAVSMFENTEHTSSSIIGGNTVKTTTRLGADPRRVASAILARIDDPDDGVVVEALQILRWRMKPQLASALPKLVARTGTTASKIKNELIATIAAAFQETDAPPLALLAMLELEPDLPTRLAVIQSLAFPSQGWTKTNRKYLDAVTDCLAKRLDVGDPDERLDLIRTLGGLGTMPRRFVPLLIKTMETEDWQHLDAASLAIVVVTPAPAEALPALARAASAQSRLGTDLSAVHAILVIDPKSPEATDLVPLLIERLQSKNDAWMITEAMDHLATLGPLAAPAVPALRASLTSRNQEILGKAARALVQIGPAAKPALPDLAKLACDQLTTIQLVSIASSKTVSAVDAVFAIDASSPEAASVLLHMAVLYRDRTPSGFGHVYQGHMRSYTLQFPAAINAVRKIAQTGNAEEKSLAEEVLRQIDTGEH